MLKAPVDFFANILDSIREPLVVLDPDLKVVKANLSFYKTFSVEPGETEGTLIYDLGNRQWDIPALRELLEISFLLNRKAHPQLFHAIALRA